MSVSMGDDKLKDFMSEKRIKAAKAHKNERDKIKSEMEERMEKGKPRYLSVDAIEPNDKMWLRVASEDAIRAYCDSIGDLNLLYRSRDHARNSVYGNIIAPPMFLNCISLFTQVGLKALTEMEYLVTGFDAGIRGEWFRIIRENEEFSVIAIPTEVIDITKKNTHLQFLVRGNKIFVNQLDEVVANINTSFVAVIPTRKEMEVRQGQKAPKPRSFSVDEVAEWYRLTKQEPVRGSNPRFWEDVEVGDQLPPTHHVFSTMEYASHMARRGNWRFEMDYSKGDWRDLLDPESGLPDFGFVHLTDEAARPWGLPRANASGPQMHCWLARLVTNWMGDHGFLKKMETQIRNSLWRDSLALLNGEVVKKYTEDNEHLVDLHIRIQDYDGTPVIPKGLATVVLPSRRMEDWRPWIAQTPKAVFC